jgi:hypothetical protein
MTMPTLTGGSSISALELPDNLTAKLRRLDITTVQRLAGRTRAALVDMLRPDEFALVDEACKRFNVTHAVDGGHINTCGRCPRCPDCGNPRADHARHVVQDCTGRYRHGGFTVGPVCDGCDTHHRAVFEAC